MVNLALEQYFLMVHKMVNMFPIMPILVNVLWILQSLRAGLIQRIVEEITF